MANGDVVVACGTCVNPDGSGSGNSDANGPGLVRLATDGTPKAFVPWLSNGVVRINAAALSNKQKSVVVAGAFTKTLTIARGIAATASAAFDGFVMQVTAP